MEEVNAVGAQALLKEHLVQAKAAVNPQVAQPGLLQKLETLEAHLNKYIDHNERYIDHNEQEKQLLNDRIMRLETTVGI